MAISPSSGQSIAFLDPRNQPRSADPVRADGNRGRAVVDDQIGLVAERARRGDQEAAYYADRRLAKTIALRRGDQIRAEQADARETLTRQRADDILRAKEEVNGPESTRALNRRDAEITAQRLLTGRQIDRAERNRQFDIARLDAQREAEANLQNAVFDPSAPRGSVVDIQA